MQHPHLIKHSRLLSLPGSPFSPFWIRERAFVATVSDRTDDLVTFTCGRTNYNRQSTHYSLYNNNWRKQMKRLLPLAFDRYKPARREAGAVYTDHRWATYIWDGRHVLHYLPTNELEPLRLSEEITLNDLIAANMRFEYFGSIPNWNREYFDKLLEGEPMEQLTSYDVQYSRGPRLSVVVHHLSPDDLPEAKTSTVADLKALDLATLSDLQGITGVDVLALDNDNPDHQLIAQVIVRSLQTNEPTNTAPNYASDVVPSLRRYTYLFSANWVDSLNKPMLFRPNPDDSNTLLCYMHAKDFVRGRLTPIKFGKMVKLLGPDLTDEEVKQIANNLQTALAPEEFAIISDPLEIVTAYRNGPSSCSTHPVTRYKEQARARIDDSQYEYHPAMVYGGESDVHLAVLRKGEKIVARSLVNTVRNTYVRIYPDKGSPHHKMETYLREHGYSQSETCLLGCVLNRVTLPNEMVIRPYIDRCNHSTLDTGECLIVVSVCGDLLSRDIEALTPKAIAALKKVVEEETEAGKAQPFFFDQVHHGYEEGASYPIAEAYKIYHHPENVEQLAHRPYVEYIDRNGVVELKTSDSPFNQMAFYPHLNIAAREQFSRNSMSVHRASDRLKAMLCIPSNVDFVDFNSMELFIEAHERDDIIYLKHNHVFYLKSELIKTLDGTLDHPSNVFFFNIKGVPYAISSTNRIDFDLYKETVKNQERADAA